MFKDLGEPETGWKDFAHLGEKAEFVARLLQGAMAQKAAGVNVLFYGPPGTGKTEFCKVLATRIGARLHAVGETDADGDEPSRHERIQQLRLSQRFLGGNDKTLILFDEMEDIVQGISGLVALFTGLRMSGGSKVHINRMLETNPVPTLWTCNDISCFDPALLRRLTFTIEMRCPSRTVRARIWQRLAKKEKFGLDDKTCARLAKDVEEPPALAVGALRAARLSGGGVADLTMTIRAVAKVMRGGHERPPAHADSTGSFSLELANTDTSLASLCARLGENEVKQAVSFCLSGPPGTGKSAFARYLATQMDLPVIQKRASEILGKYVGETEKNIAAAFAEAQEDGAMLIFDEVDSLLCTREMSRKSWEVSQVNEMLTWMEIHPLPFACTTNMAGRLDAASLRRFTFKIAFRPLDKEQLGKAFRHFFNTPVPPAVLALDNLTPGDFASVRRRMLALGVSDRMSIAVELRKESAAKPGTSRPIGFRPAC